MVKCGNRSVSSKSGSADVLEALNIPLDLDPSRAVRQFGSSNFTFLFAPAYNPAIAHVQPVRKALGVSTLFNTMNPLLSPARPEYQIMGIANPAQGQRIAETMRELGRGRDGSITSYVLTPEALGLQRCSLEDLRGGDGAANAAAIRATFTGEGPEAHRSAVASGAGAMFHLNGSANSIADGVNHALDLLADGTVHAWLQQHEEADYSA